MAKTETPGIWKRHFTLERLLLAVLLTCGLGAGFAWGAWRNLCNSCPSVAQIRTFEPEQASRLYSHDGRLIREFGYERRTPVSIEALPEYVPQAYVAVEDKRFYRHRGFDPIGFARAVMGVLTGRNLGGGSTITQQLARNMFDEEIGFERRYVRKLKELQVAFALERSYTKDEILEGYFNQINYGHGWWGIQTAARNYFGKSATELNPAEAALMAAIPNRPGSYSPLLNPEAATRRRNLVLNRMATEGFLSAEEAERWKQEPVPTKRAEGGGGSVAPYFEEWVRQILDDRFGSKLYTDGLQIYSTLDVRMQKAADAAMEEGWARIEERPDFEPLPYDSFAGKPASEVLVNGQTPYLQGVLVALDPWTGSVRAMVGGRDFGQSEFNRATQARRQAGSGFKPFVYTTAIDSRIPPTHIVVDAPVVMMQVDGSEWKPRNFGNRFDGPMTIRTGLQRSINMISVKLANEVGLEGVAQTARRMGIRTEIERFPSTAIGAAEVIPIEMAEAYSGFANLGTKVRPFPILRVEDSQGRIIWDPEPERTRVLDQAVARIMVSMLQGVVDYGTGYTALRIVAGLPHEVVAAGKTGTTNDGTDVWFNAFTGNLIGTVWFGMDAPARFRDSPSGGATGGGDAAPAWGLFMKRVYYGDPESEDPDLRRPILPIPEPWGIPDGVTTRVIDKPSGKLASEWCPEERRFTELFLPGTEPTEYCDVRDARMVENPGAEGDGN